MHMHERWGNIPDISRQKSGRQSTDRRKSRRNSSQQPKQSKVQKRKCLKQIFHRHIQSEAIVNQVHKRRTFGSTFVYRSRCLGISRKSVPALLPNAPSSFTPNRCHHMWLPKLHGSTSVQCRDKVFFSHSIARFNIYTWVWPFCCRLVCLRFIFVCFLYLPLGFIWLTADHVLSRKTRKTRRTPSELTELTFFIFLLTQTTPSQVEPEIPRARHLEW